MKAIQSCLILGNPMDYIDSGVPQVRILEWAAFLFSRGSSQPRDRTQSPTLQADSLPVEPQGKPKNSEVGSISLLQRIFLTQESNPVDSSPTELSQTNILKLEKGVQQSYCHPVYLYAQYIMQNARLDE